jgi:benzoate-CoA ligase
MVEKPREDLLPDEVRAPKIELPPRYNAAADLIGRNLAAGRADRIAFRDDRVSLSYGALADRVDRAAGLLRGLGLQPEQRIVLALLDTVDFPTMFLGAIKAGIVPVPVNTMLTAPDCDFILRDSRARAIVLSDALEPRLAPILADQPHLRWIAVSGETAGAYPRLDRLLAEAPAATDTADTTPDDVAFWLYTSGSTGQPKGVAHLHAHPARTAHLFAEQILGMRDDDVIFSASKLFFAYGLGNALTFPLAIGATGILTAERPTPAVVSRILRDRRPTIFCGVPTLYGTMLASADLPPPDTVALRRCVSAGEALPAEIGRRWWRHFGVDILDGIGSTEMLHTFLSNRPDDVRYGTTGKPVPGYMLRIVDDDGRPVAPGELGELQVSGPTSAPYYWNDRARSRETFLGPWTRTGDKFRQDADGYYVYGGRRDDMLKVGGIYVSPAEVEAALTSHEAVLEAAVVGSRDESALVKPKAFIVLKPHLAPSADLAEELKTYVKSHLAPYKYPRWIEFVDELPKTATGKIQRFKLRPRGQEIGDSSTNGATTTRG